MKLTAKRIIKIILTIVGIFLMLTSGVMNEFTPDMDDKKCFLGIAIFIIANLKDIIEELKRF